MISAGRKATREHTKAHNRRLLLRTIYDQGQISRVDIARRTRLARATVSNAVAELIQDGLVTEVGQDPSTGGKPATLLSVIDGSRHLIGLDLADSEFRGAVFDLRGKVISRVSAPVERANGETTLQLVCDLVDELVASATSPLVGLGIGVPGIVDVGHGVIRDTVHLDWQGLPLGDLLKERYGRPVYVVNDSHAAALAEYTFGDHGGIFNLVVLKLGPGVGVGIVLNGRLHYGDDYAAGEIGHTTIAVGGEPCLCGHQGCLETVVSRRALLKRAQTIARTNPASRLHQFAPSPEAIDTTGIVLRAFEAGDEDLRQVVVEMGQTLGLAVAGLVGVLNVHRIVLAGSMSRFGEPLLEAIRQQMRRCAHERLVENTEVGLSKLGQDIVMKGAAAMLLSQELGLV